jgi:hypothetical protein
VIPEETAEVPREDTGWIRDEEDDDDDDDGEDSDTKWEEEEVDVANRGTRKGSDGLRRWSAVLLIASAVVLLLLLLLVLVLVLLLVLLLVVVVLPAWSPSSSSQRTLCNRVALPLPPSELPPLASRLALVLASGRALALSWCSPLAAGERNPSNALPLMGLLDASAVLPFAVAGAVCERCGAVPADLLVLLPLLPVPPLPPLESAAMSATRLS